MSVNSEPAAEFWEVERHSCGSIQRPHCVVVLRRKNGTGRSVVTATSSDFESIQYHADRLTEDLFTLTNAQFVEKYNLSNVA